MIHKKLALELEIVKLVDKITMRRGVGKNNPEQLYIGEKRNKTIHEHSKVQILEISFFSIIFVSSIHRY